MTDLGFIQIPRVPATFWVALCLVVAGILGELGFRALKLPRIAGYVLAGMIAALFGVGLHEHVMQDNVRVVIELGLAVLLFEAGSRIDLRWLRANPWLLVTCLAESLLAFAAVVVALTACGVQATVAIPIGAIVMATSPAVLMGVANEFRAAGQVTERMIVLSGINTCLAVLLSHLLLGWLHLASGSEPLRAVGLPLYQLVGSAVVAGVLAWVSVQLAQRLDLRSDSVAVLQIGMILLALSVAAMASLSVLLVPLLAGLILKNVTDRAGGWTRQFGTAGTVLILLLFVATASVWTFDLLLEGAALALVVIAARFVAKVLATTLFARPSGLSSRQGLALGLCALPLSSPALVIYTDLQAVAPDFGASIAPILLVTIAMLELVAPLVVIAALRWVGEDHAR